MLTLVKETHVDFMSKRRIFYVFSLATVVIGLISFVAHKGLRMGVDFAGGRLVEFQVNREVSVDQVRSATSAAGFERAEIQHAGESGRVLIRIPGAAEQRGGEASPSALIRNQLVSEMPGSEVTLLREESVGAKVGKEIRGEATLAVLIAMVLILIYVGIRFEWWFGVGAVIALAHDVLFVLAVFSLLNREISMPVIAALLTIAGYSVNDTIVVFDRVREQLVRLRREPFYSVLNISINQTLGRTLITGVTTIFASFSLLLFGGDVLRDFALAMTIGLIIGTYSSIFVASALVLELRKAKEVKPAAA